MSWKTLNTGMKKLSNEMSSMIGSCDSIISGLNTTQLDFSVIEQFNNSASACINILNETLNSSSELELVLREYNTDIQGFISTTHSIMQYGYQLENFSNSLETAFAQVQELADEISQLGGGENKSAMVSVSVSVTSNGTETDNTGINYKEFADFYSDYKTLLSAIKKETDRWYTELFERD